MRQTRPVWSLLFAAIVTGCLLDMAWATHPTSNVPPTLEIEVLDPNADPQSRPAVELEPGRNGGMVVDIPPVVLVHRYYFTGERSFQAQLLPGGPSIVVANHPTTGQRCYIDVQMPPGAPRVTYTDHSIEYDFGVTGVSVCFGMFGAPSVKYRSGPSLKSRVNELLHVEEVKTHLQTAQDNLEVCAGRTKMMAHGAVATIGDATGRMLLPVKNVAQTLPLGKIVFDPTRGEKLMRKADEHEREVEIRRLEKQREYEELTRKTVR